MSSERLYTTEAIIVRRRDQGEADRVLTLCTPQGKRVVIARGARKPTSRKAGHLELFARVQMVLARSPTSWDVVSQAEALDLHAALRGDLVYGTYARYIAELYDRFVTEEEGGPALFDLLSRALDVLSQMAAEGIPSPALDLLVRAYEQRLLTLVGFRPEWDRCVGEREGRPCGRVLPVRGKAPLGLDPERGGALCPQCFQAAADRRWVIPLSPAALGLLRACQRLPFARLRQRRAAPPLLAEAERAMRHYLTYHLEQDVRTGVFLRQVRRNIATPHPAMPEEN
ncbi:MAG: DNA repair protein RecO [Anaerolineae bacterium]|nr:DNA repair protein RecO [Anaerolineae bacterium]MDW8067457.1 DNA repair protein RecO [Anaerolineae bacterium]